PANLFNSPVPALISSILWTSGASHPVILDLVFSLYEEMPCYGLLMPIAGHFHDLDTLAVEKVIRAFRGYLSEAGDMLARPVQYVLCCDFFEYDELVQRMWDALTAQSVQNVHLALRLMEVSGPVPYPLKEPVYMEYLRHSELHFAIALSLARSVG